MVGLEKNFDCFYHLMTICRRTLSEVKRLSPFVTGRHESKLWHSLCPLDMRVKSTEQLEDTVKLIIKFHFFEAIDSEYHHAFLYYLKSI